jgi:parallel beta-helix repeat protein
MENNTLSNCGNYGFALFGITSNCTITENIISKCGNATIEGLGMRMMNFEASEISSNRISDCTSHGILIEEGCNSTIMWNTITNSSGYATTLLSDSTQILVKFNSFIENGLACQVQDNGTLNEFSHNYYNDWTTPDNNADGYVDTPYPIDGISGNLDRFPLVNAGVIPTEAVSFSPEIVVLILSVGLVVVLVVLYRRNR